MPSTQDWYDPNVYPELRDRAPWVMEEMVAAESSLPGTLDGAAAAAQQIADAIRDAVRAGGPVVVTGMGTAGHAAQAVAQLVNDAVSGSVGAPGPAEFRDASAQAAAPRRGGLCLAISHGGRSESTVDALDAATATGGRTALVTASPDTPAGEAAQLVLTTPLQDGSYCHTVGYLSPILAAMCVASAYRGEAFPAARVTAYLESLQQIGDAAQQVGAALHGAERVIAAGSLHDVPPARELALKIAEGARLPTTWLGVENTLHGHLVGHDGRSALVAFATGGPGGERMARTAENLLLASRRIGLRTAAIISEPLAGDLSEDATTAGRIVVPESDLPQAWTSALGAALALQHLTIGLVRATGVNPDLIRREEEPYREAVALGRTKALHR